MIPSLIQSESGGNWQAQNDIMGAGGMSGHFGRLQFGQARLQDAINAGVLPPGTTPEQFMANPQLQMAVEQWHFDDIDRQAEARGLTQFYGQTIAGVPITPNALRAMAHLGGIGGAERFLESGGQYNPSDAFGTSLLDYARAHGGGELQLSGGGYTGRAGNAPQMAQGPQRMPNALAPEDFAAMLEARQREMRMQQLNDLAAAFRPLEITPMRGA